MHAQFLNRYCVILLAAVVLSACSPSEDPGSMQPVDGYPELTDIDEIKQVLNNKCVDTISFNKGEVIADIGAGNGYLEAMLSMFHDSLTFYIQDIDTAVCNQEAIDDAVDFYESVHGKPFTNKFKVVNGNDTITGLPYNSFDKIMMLWTYQYLKEPEIFMSDVRDNLKENGYLYLINPEGDPEHLKTLTEEYGWNASTLAEEIRNVISFGFELISISRNCESYEQAYIMVFRKKALPKV